MTDDPLAAVRQAISRKEYAKAVELLVPVVAENSLNEPALLLQARCDMALRQHAAAGKIYSYLLQQEKLFSPAARAEAALILGQPRSSLTLLAPLVRADLLGETALLAAVCAYCCGRMTECLTMLMHLVKSGEEWDEEAPIEVVIEHALERSEYHDLEQMYLDAQEMVQTGNLQPRNRWFSINMPVYELYTASRAERRQQRAAALIRILAPGETLSPEGARERLCQILQDFAASETDARFGLESLKHLEAGQWSEVARLIMAMQLEHLRQFAGDLGLEGDRIAASALQQLIPLLPLRPAMGLMLLYAIADDEDRMLQQMVQNIEEELLAALIQVAFHSFYVDMERIRLLNL
ncbi:MAG TPA: hypothetical protein PLG50_02805 [bacterium]|nr:hypothetical protein [bacterium]HQG44575.1 hypothetical protein [bacterium]HQI49763.1 hypothetical protein [bacterium]HQJ63916.1 hypothetical protein [bacterium]